MKKKDSGSTGIYRACYAIFAGIVGILFNIKVVNRENETDNGGFLVCANHVSASDAVVIAYAFKKHQVMFMAKKELFKVPFVGSLVKMLGAFPIDRSGNDVGAIKKAVGILEDGKCLGIFPQGHRYPEVDPRTTQRKNGAALICTRAKADVVPVYIWRKNNKFRLFARTYVVIGKRIPFDSLGYNTEATGEYKRITDDIFNVVCDMGEEFDAGLKNKKIKKDKKNK